MIVKPGGAGRPAQRHLGEPRALAAEQVAASGRCPRPCRRPTRRCSAWRPCGRARRGVAVVAIGRAPWVGRRRRWRGRGVSRLDAAIVPAGRRSRRLRTGCGTVWRRRPRLAARPRGIEPPGTLAVPSPRTRGAPAAVIRPTMRASSTPAAPQYNARLVRREDETESASPTSGSASTASRRRSSPAST